MRFIDDQRSRDDENATERSINSGYSALTRPIRCDRLRESTRAVRSAGHPHRRGPFFANAVVSTGRADHHASARARHLLAEQRPGADVRTSRAIPCPVHNRCPFRPATRDGTDVLPGAWGRDAGHRQQLRPRQPSVLDSQSAGESRRRCKHAGATSFGARHHDRRR